MLSKLAVRRILILANHMAKLGSRYKHFDMGTWFRHHPSTRTMNELHVLEQDRLAVISERQYERKKRKILHGFADGRFVSKKHMHACGTSACAGGHAPTIPYFRRLGLKLVIHEEGSSASGTLVFKKGKREFYHLDALSKAFDVSMADARDLFGIGDSEASACDTPKQWANFARCFVKINTAPES